MGLVRLETAFSFVYLGVRVHMAIPGGGAHVCTLVHLETRDQPLFLSLSILLICYITTPVCFCIFRCLSLCPSVCLTPLLALGGRQ